MAEEERREFVRRLQALEVGKGLKITERDERDLPGLQREVAAIGRQLGRVFKVVQIKGEIMVVRKA